MVAKEYASYARMEGIVSTFIQKMQKCRAEVFHGASSIANIKAECSWYTGGDYMKNNYSTNASIYAVICDGDHEVTYRYTNGR